MNWEGPEFEGIAACAEIEIDFLGKAVQKNTETMELQGALRLRHAWMKLEFGSGWSLFAGRTWDVFATEHMRRPTPRSAEGRATSASAARSFVSRR